MCDDGNLVNYDGCNSSCMAEDGWSCTKSGVESTCTETCGDEIMTVGEVCDDAGISGACQECSSVVTGWHCTDTCVEIHGDGI